MFCLSRIKHALRMFEPENSFLRKHPELKKVVALKQKYVRHYRI